ncbi:MAG TPA: ABC transporter transmembrane domain-containing protein [Xanthobacteraceae bacterium]|nr:ABC transporter transmembrane domain-containing protein [Xanthobacteraceae bacterium]
MPTLVSLSSRLFAIGPWKAAARRPISVVSVVNGKRIHEPTFPLPVYFASLAINLLALAMPLSIMQVYDRIIPNHSLGTLALLFFGLALALIIEFVLKVMRSALLCWQTKCFVRDTENEAIARVLRAPESEFEHRPAAVHMNRYAAVSALGDYHCGAARLVSIDLPFVAIGLTVMSTVGGIMVFVPIGLFFVFSTLAMHRSRKLRDVLHDRAAQDNRKYDFIAEVLGGIHTVKILALEPQMQRRFERLQQAVAETTMSSILTGQAAQTSALLYGSISQLIVVAIGATRVIDNQLSMGALACCTMLSGQILQPLLGAISQWMENETLYQRRQEVRELLDMRELEVASPECRSIRGDISFENVTFAYDAAAASILHTIDFSVTAGEIIGIKGEDGSGRTTLINLLLGEIKPVSGRVMVDEISTVAPEFLSLRRHMITVRGAPVIFRGTIMENLTVFRPERRERARKMTRLFGLDASINLMPDGFETRLGEALADDLPISIAQQLNIVRALTSNPKILVLDEANAALDVIAEAALIRAIDSLRGHLTIIIVTHRPSLLARADRVLVVRKGRVGWETSAPDSSVRAS